MSDDIVVGIDDSAAARAALDWAAAQARRTGSTLRAVHVLDWPTGARADGMPLVDDWLFVQDGVHDTACRATITDLFQHTDPPPDWSVTFARGKAGAVLVQAAEDAALLVVGTGEHVGLGRVLIGSTSHYCLSHASCPVVAVPAPHLPATAGPAETPATAAGRDRSS